MSDDVLTLSTGSDVLLALDFEDEDGPINLTGYTAEVYGASTPELAAQLTAWVADAATGQVAVRLLWADSLLNPEVPLSFRARVRAPVSADFPAGQRTASRSIRVVFR